MDKKIEVVYLKPSEINTKFGNPRKIQKKKRDELKRSLDVFGDFGCLIVDENNSIIGGNQRLAILKEEKPDEAVLCKKLVGYSDAEKRSINIKANTHSGEWDNDLLADWIADLNVDLGIKEDGGKSERDVREMELIPFEKYNYLLIVCKSELDWNVLLDKFSLTGNEKAVITEKKKIKARAVWFHDVADRFK